MGFAGTVVGLICGGGVAVGLFFVGMLQWPPESVEGTCQVTDPASVTYECTKGTKSSTFKLNMANVTFEDGSVRQCNTFFTTDNCGILGSDQPTDVLQGEARTCYWFESEVRIPGVGGPAGACAEPWYVGGNKGGSIAIWILGALLSCCCLGFGVGSDVKGGPRAFLEYLEDSGPPVTAPPDKYDIAHAKGDKEDAGALPGGGKAATATDADCV
eukprot:gnl/TRDRNA2_/TRDRNA2_167818_c0_seq7.p1 gnl/TRDRNA2_/TRDRNA2_167818_c0~~gnl/TRDRNA2_/TRDRNA2_167818_c0_seq7.p1  ORF type:complete len:214 (-),score=20.13 gnl/TRDRNA2_/TRDRNA2_167818_c0_seq7:347-988(-)